MIDEFAQAVARQSGCDDDLAERLRHEILDHLYQAAEDEGGPPDDAMRAAIGRFGEPELFAGEYTQIVQERRSRTTRNIAIFAIGAVFVSMRLRSFVLPQNWHEAILSTDWGGLLMFVDRYAFILAIIVILCDMLCEKHCHSMGRAGQTIFGINRVFALPLISAALIALSSVTGIVSVVTSQVGALFLGVSSVSLTLFVGLLMLLTGAVILQLYRHISVFLGRKMPI